MSEWYSGIEATVFTQLEYMLTIRDKAPFPKLNCRTTSETITPAKFPTLYLHETQEELGEDLTNETVNAVNSTLYVRVWTNTSEQDCKDILVKATEELKRLHYNVRNLPTTQLTDKIAYGEIMARRVIGNADKDIVET